MTHGNTDCGIYATPPETLVVERCTDAHVGQLESSARWQPVTLLVWGQQSFIWIVDDVGSGP
jgi:hypothetical protein